VFNPSSTQNQTPASSPTSSPIARPARRIAFALGLCAAAAAHAAGPYTLTDLGSKTFGHGMNADGVVAGEVNYNNVTAAAALWHPDTATWTTLRLGWTAYAVNRAGAAVGNDSNHQTLDTAIRWSPSGVPHALRPDISFSNASDIDDAGTAYGYYYNTTDQRYHAVTWTGDVATELGCPDGYQCAAVTGNGHGVIAGNVMEIFGPLTWPALVQDGQWNLLPTRGGCGAVYGVNARGHVVGSACQDASGFTSHGFIWKDGRVRDLGSLQRDWNSIALAINAHDVIAGQVQQPGTLSKAAVWEDGTWTVLADVTAGSEGYQFSQAVGIDATGRVLVNASGPDGKVHALVLTPVVGN